MKYFQHSELNNDMMNFKMYKLYLIVLFPLFMFSQKTEAPITWIDKNENENYVARHECSFVQIGDKFMLFGGRESAQRIDIYDYYTNTWSTGKKAPKEFNHFQATAYQGFIWVVGAFKTNSFPREIPEEYIWLYFPPTNSWIKGPEIPENRRRGGAGLAVYQNKFYIIGGNTIGHDGGYVNWFDEYNPEANTWTILEDASQQRDHFSAAIIGENLYAAGGRKSGGAGGVFSPLPAIVDVYNFDSKTWSKLEANLPTPRAAPGVIVYNNELLVIGGEGEQRGPAYKLVEAYNPETGEWTRKTDMKYARHGTQAILSGNGVYIAAGSPVQGGGRQRNMEVYGEDNAQGIELVGSKLVAKRKVQIAKGETTTIKLNNIGGNTGVFISEVTLGGAHENEFEVDSVIENTLVRMGEEVSIKISHLGEVRKQKAFLKIVYNGDQELIINLTSK